jgi:hypothetical protein
MDASLDTLRAASIDLYQPRVPISPSVDEHQTGSESGVPANARLNPGGAALPGSADDLSRRFAAGNMAT